MLKDVYLFCLAIGVIYTLFTTFISGIVSAIDLAADAHFDFHHVDIGHGVHGDIGGHGDFGHGHADVGHDHGAIGDIGHTSFLLPLRPFTIMIFLTVFGGVGFILTRLLMEPVTLIISFLAAYLVDEILYRTIYLRLVRAQTEAKTVDDAIGLKAKVIVRIPHGGLGRITYTVDGNILSGAALEMDADSNGYTQDTEVFIHQIKDNIYYVSERPLAAMAKTDIN